jgi:hypothetical protein
MGGQVIELAAVFISGMAIGISVATLVFLRGKR